MAILSALGEFPEMVLGLAFGFGCALLLGFGCLRLLLALMTRQQVSVTHNGINEPSHVRSILWLGAAVSRFHRGSIAGSKSDRDRGATGIPFHLPAASPRNRFARNAKLNIASTGRVVELPQLAAESVASGGSGDRWGGDAA